MNFSSSLRVAARGSALSVSCRGIGSANGNRTRICRLLLFPISY
jgi:hypothetical protein